jgi:hypothetical protein
MKHKTECHTSGKGPSEIRQLIFSTLGSLAILSQLHCASSAPAPQSEVASIDVALQSIGTFDHYVDTLQPKFVLTSDDALQKAIPVTQLSDLETLRAFAASLRLALPSLSVNKQSVATSTGGSSTDTSTTTRSFGSTPLTSVPSPPAATTPSFSPLTIPSAAQPGVDSLLQYRAATALLQEVALLSSYVRDAAVSRGSVPYVARLLLTVFPARHDVPYDAYTTISVFAPPDTDDNAAVPGVLARSFLQLPTKEQNTIRQMIGWVVPAAEELPITVVPLFVTDDIESSFRSTTNVATRGYDFSAGGGLGGAAATAGLAKQATDAASILGQAINGTQTLARPAENVIVVRLGASYIGRTFTLLPRTYSVTVLLLVPTVASRPKNLNAFIQKQMNLDHLAAAVRSLTTFSQIQRSPENTTDQSKNQEERQKVQEELDRTRTAQLQYYATQVIPRTLLRYNSTSDFVHVQTGKPAVLPDRLWLASAIRREYQDAAGVAGKDATVDLEQLHLNDIATTCFAGVKTAIVDANYYDFELNWKCDQNCKNNWNPNGNPNCKGDQEAHRVRADAWRVWPQMVRLGQRLGSSGGQFTLPPAVFLAPDQDRLEGLVLKDDGDAMTLVLTDFLGLAPSGDLDARLAITWTGKDDGEKSGRDDSGATIHTSDVRNVTTVVSPDGRGATLTFPSLTTLGPLCPKRDESAAPTLDREFSIGQPLETARPAISPENQKPPAKEQCGVRSARMMSLSYSEHPMSALFSDLPQPAAWKMGESVVVNYAKVQKPKSTISMTMQSPRIVVDEQGIGELTIDLHSTNDMEIAKLVVEGADIIGLESAGFKGAGPSTSDKGADRNVIAGQRLTIHFENLAAGSQVRVHVQSTDGKTEATGSPANAVAIARSTALGRKTPSQ